MSEIRSECKILIAKPEGRHHFGDLNVDGKIIMN
jgi:hypothetical protein